MRPSELPELRFVRVTPLPAVQVRIVSTGIGEPPGGRS